MYEAGDNVEVERKYISEWEKISEWLSKRKTVFSEGCCRIEQTVERWRRDRLTCQAVGIT